MSSNFSDSLIATKGLDWKEFLFCGSVTATLGVLGMCNNAITTLVIWRNKTLRTSCFILIAGHACYCFVMAAGFATLGVHYLGLGFNFLTAAYPQITCAFLYMTTTFSSPSSAVMSFLIAMERLSAFAFPMAYRKNSGWITRVALAVAAAAGVLCAVVAVGTAPRPWWALVKCVSMFSSFSAEYSVFFTYFNLGFSILAVLCYGVMHVCIKLKKKKPTPRDNVQNVATLEFNRFMKGQMKLLPMVNALTIGYGVFGVGPPLIASTFSVAANGTHLQRASVYVMALKSLLPFVDFCILTFKCFEFRSTLKSLFGIKPNQIQAITYS